jgi:hypothetical protein
MSAQKYKYKPLSDRLQEIRLLHLKPGRSEDEIECSLVHASFPPIPEAYDPKLPLSDQAVSRRYYGEKQAEVREYRRLKQKVRSLGRPSSSTKAEPTNAKSTSIPSIPIYEALSYTVSMLDLFSLPLAELSQQFVSLLYEILSTILEKSFSVLISLKWLYRKLLTPQS